MTRESEGRRAPRVVGAGQEPLRTCVGCRRVRPQALLLRITRTREGFVEPDPLREGGGRGAYLCLDEGCLSEAVRRGRWTQAFRAPALLRPETVARVRALLGGGPEPGPPSPVGCHAGSRPAARVRGRTGERVEGSG